MVDIRFINAGVDIPIFSAVDRSFKNSLIKFASGSKLSLNQSGKVLVHALRDLCFHFSEGDKVGLVGNNGAGKTSLLRMLSGVYQPTSGSVSVRGRIGSLIDLSLGVDQEATGRENIMLRGALLGLTFQEISSRLDEIIEFSELGAYIDMPVRTYSAGMQMRLAFSVSTVVQPDILLMDEWLSVGDESFRRKAQDRLSELIDSTKILIIASHSRGLIENTCNRVLLLENGQIKLDGEPGLVCSAHFV